VQHPWRPTYLNRGGDAVDAAVAVDTTDNQE
jgi:gamma-glutamyltranspeptidase